MTLTGCGTDDNGGPATSAAAGGDGPATADCVSASLAGAGSSFQAPMQQQWSADYLANCPTTKVNYNSIGSGAGIQQFVEGTVDFAGSDVALTADEQDRATARCGGHPAIHLPVTAGGVAITYNLDGVDDLRLSPKLVAGIFQGTITKWDDPAIKAENPHASLPGERITVFHRSDGSGTTAVFTAYLAASEAGWTLGSGKTVGWPTGQGAKGNEGVSAGVSQTSGAITYTEQGFAMVHKLPTALIRNSGGTYVSLTAGHVSAALDEAEPADSPRDVTVALNYQPTAADAYPISTVSYVIVCSAYPDGFGATKAQALREYLDFAVTAGQSQAEMLGFAKLPQALASRGARTIDAIAG